MAESGVKNFTAYAWQGLVGPQNMPAEVVQKLSADLQAVLKTPEVNEKITAMGVEPLPMNAADFKAYAEAQRKEWADVIKKAGRQPGPIAVGHAGRQMRSEEHTSELQ